MKAGSRWFRLKTKKKRVEWRKEWYLFFGRHDVNPFTVHCDRYYCRRTYRGFPVYTSYLPLYFPSYAVPTNRPQSANPFRKIRVLTHVSPSRLPSPRFGMIPPCCGKPPILLLGCGGSESDAWNVFDFLLSLAMLLACGCGFQCCVVARDF